MLPQPVGVGLRPVHYPYLQEGPRTGVGWFEVISENFMNTEGRPLEVLRRMRRDFPIGLHGVSLSIGYEPDPTDAAACERFAEERTLYLDRLRGLIDRIDPWIVTDHLCWTGVPGGNVHDLLPLPYTEHSLDWIARQLDIVQNALGRTIALENPSSYLTFRSSEMSEQEFLVELTRRSGAQILLDVNNVYVSATNHGFDPVAYLDAIPSESVAQIHLAGHTDMGTHLFDTHAGPVCDTVWELFDRTVARLPEVPVLIEWDADIPEFSVLESEAAKAAAIRERHHGALGAASGVGV